MTDVRYAIRSLVRARWFTAAAVLTFAVGIGLNLAVFAVVDRVLFRQLPYGEPDQLVLLRACDDAGRCAGGFPSVVAWAARERLKTIDGVAVAAWSHAQRISPSAADPPLRLIDASRDLLRVLHVQPRLGRDFSQEDAAQKRRVVLLGHDVWQRRFGGSTEIVGRTLGTGRSALTVIGILPPDFIPPAWTAADPAWDGLILQTSAWTAIGPSGMIAVPVARLAGGVSLEAVRAEVAALVTSLGSDVEWESEREPIIRVDRLQYSLFSRFRDHATLIVIAAAVLLLLACANLATLLLARGRSREQALAVHACLGASPLRLIALALVESVAICVGGTIIALAALAVTSTALLSIVPPLFARYASSPLDARVLGLALGAAVLSAAAAAVLPALRVSRVDPLPVLRRVFATTQSARLRGSGSLLVIEAALGVTLVLAGLVISRSFVNLAATDLGFRPAHLYAISLRGMSAVDESREARLVRYEQVIEILGTIPGVEAAVGADSPVGSGMAPMRPFTADRSIRGGRYQVSAGYFDTLRTPLLAGREFTRTEVETRAPVAILNASAARELFPGARPDEVLGRPVVIGAEPRRTLVGVVSDIMQRYDDVPTPSLFLPLGAEPSNYVAAVIRMESGTAPPVGLIQQRLVDVFGQQVIPEVSSVSAGLDRGLQDPRFRAVVFSVLALTGLLLGAVGLYAVASFEVAMRRYEMGVRLTLGARGGDIQRMVLLDACRPIVLGIGLGLVGAYWAERYVRSFMYGVEPRDPAIYTGVIAILLGTALVAAWLPARRAARLDPAEVLRAH